MVASDAIKDDVWWGKVNKPIPQEVFDELYDKIIDSYSNTDDFYVFGERSCFCHARRCCCCSLLLLLLLLLTAVLRWLLRREQEDAALDALADEERGAAPLRAQHVHPPRRQRRLGDRL